MLAVLPALLLLLLLSSRSACGVFQKLYCSFSDSCDCDFKPNIRDLEWDLYKNVFGQHLAQDLVAEEVSRFLLNKSPDRPLVLSFHGSSGTGKTLVSTMLGNHLYGSAMSSPFVHQFVPALHFPSAERVAQYQNLLVLKLCCSGWQAELKNWVKGNLTACSRSVFIFDEMEKMPAGLIDVLEPFLGPSHVVFRTNYRKAIYVFISTAGQEAIHRLILENRRAGRDRDEIKPSDLQEVVQQSVYSNKTNGLYLSSIVQQNLITRFVPFLPLTRTHVERCVRAQLCQRGSCNRDDVVEAVGGDMTYDPAEGHYFSTTGCKAVAAKISFFL
ncbi:prosalusin isoform X1 [Xiphophorus maculatus]|uniref:prosalusin isoform X1 n=1 Tax=Xiphophorus maculatus TaxID=8083 RepID=UPI000C6CD485|nr:prosalusin isoform X1 [Xiphophorus maculatus]